MLRDKLTENANGSAQTDCHVFDLNDARVPAREEELGEGMVRASSWVAQIERSCCPKSLRLVHSPCS